MRSLDRQTQNLERKADATRSEEQKKEYRRQARAIRGEVEKARTRNRRFVSGAQAYAARDHPGRHGCGAGPNRELIEAKPPPGSFDCQEIHQPRIAVSRPDSGRQHRLDEGRRQIRIPPRLQVFDVCHVVDSAGQLPARLPIRRVRYAIPVHMIQTINKLIRTSRQLVQELGREPTSEEIAKAHGHSRRESAQGAQDRAGADLAGNADRRRRRLASGRLHRGSRRGFSGGSVVINVNLKDQTGQVLRTLTPREEKSHQDAVRPRRRQRTHSGRSRPIIRSHARTHPPDRSQGAAETQASVEI